MSTLENKFHEDMNNIYFTAKKELKYNASRFIQLYQKKAGLKQQNNLSPRWRHTVEVLWENIVLTYL